MKNLTLTINSGSSSVKFGLFNYGDKKGSVFEVCRGSVDGIGSNPVFNIVNDYLLDFCKVKATSNPCTQLNSIEEAHRSIAQWVSSFLKPDQIVKVCYRIVHGGDYYCDPVAVDTVVLKKLKSLIPLSPLHQPGGLNAINIFMECFPKSRHLACFDTAFHINMPKVSKTFALPLDLHEQGVKPYGFHGLSYQYNALKLLEINGGKLPRRTVIAHLGSGASMCALLNGVSIATTMTFSPLDGLPMATRTGSLDANAVIYMIEHLKFTTAKVSEVLNQQSGLLGLSGISGDVKVLINSESEKAKFALEFYIHRICRELGAMLATLRGLDALVFTGGVGAKNDVIRQMVCEQFEWFGISLEQSANKNNNNIISNYDSSVLVFSIKTDEELMMAQLVLAQGG